MRHRRTIRIGVVGGDNMGWSVDHDRENLKRFLGAREDVTLVSNPLVADALISVWYSQLMSRRYAPLRVWKSLLGRPLAAVLTNDIGANATAFVRLRRLVDIWIAPSSRTTEYLDRAGVEAIEIPFYVSSGLFHRVPLSRQEVCGRLGVRFERIAGRCVVGSFQRDSLGSDLRLPKPEKNPGFLVQLARRLGLSRSVLLLAGPRRHYLVNACRAQGVPYLFVGDERMLDPSAPRDDVAVNNLPPVAVNLLYNLCDVYVVSSISEGGPKAVVEAALARTPIFSTDVGMARDFLCSESLFDLNQPDTLVDRITRCLADPAYATGLVSANHSRATELMADSTYLARIEVLVSRLKARCQRDPVR